MTAQTEKTPQGVDDLYPPKWVKAADLEGRSVQVKIVGVTVESFYIAQDGATKRAAVVAIEKTNRRLILNKTQARAIAEAIGSDRFSDWVGQAITLVPGRTANGKPTIVIRPANSGPERSKKP